jgi:hypothetical protein
MASSAPSYTKIDYSIRPAKAIERKMMIDLIRRLDRFTSLSHYRYVGFGSPYFADFKLFHKSLGIGDLISIEKEVADEPRFRFNAPFAAIDLKFGESAEILPELMWSQRSITWLDYDGRLDVSKLDDVSFLARHLAGGSVLTVSVNVDPHRDIETRLDKTRAELGSYMPRHYSAEDLGGWGTAEACREIIDERIRTALGERNTGQSLSAAISFRQLFNFRYRDGARMLTVGGVLFDAGQEASLRGCAFDEFEFCKEGADAYEIDVPRLTLKEMRHLDTQLPCDTFGDLTDVGIPIGDAEKYARLYRYSPKFLDTEP